MLPLDEALSLTREWNAVHLDDAQVPETTVVECYRYLNKWRDAIAKRWMPELIDIFLQRHNELANQIPDELLLTLLEDDPCSDAN